MLPIKCSSPGFGDFSWSPPTDIQQLILQMPAESQMILIGEIRRFLQQFISIIAGGLLGGPNIAEALTMIDETMTPLATRLRDLYEQE